MRETELAEMRSQTDLSRVKNEAQKLLISQEVEAATGIPAEDFIRPLAPEPPQGPTALTGDVGDTLRSLMALGSAPQDEQLRQLAATEPVPNLASATLGTLLDVFGAPFRFVGLDVPRGLETFGSAPGFEELASRRERVLGIEQAAHAPGLEFAGRVAPTIIGGQVDLAQLMAQIEMQRIGLESQEIQTEAQLEVDRARLGLEAETTREEFAVEREKIEAQREESQARLSLLEREFNQRREEWTHRMEVDIEQLRQGQQRLFLEEQRILSPATTPAGEIEFERQVQTEVGGVLFGLKTGKEGKFQTSGKIVDALQDDRILSREEIRQRAAAAASPQEREQIVEAAIESNATIYREAIAGVLAADPNITVESLNQAMKQTLTDVLTNADNLLGATTTLKDYQGAEARRRVAERIVGVSNVLEEMVQTKHGDQIVALVDDSQIQARLLEMDATGVTSGGYGRRLANLRTAIRQVASSLGLTGPLWSAELQESLETRIGGEARQTIDLATNFMQSQAQMILDVRRSNDPRQKELLRDRLGRGLNLMGLGNNIFQSKK
jgi:hypothetical protein